MKLLKKISTIFHYIIFNNNDDYLFRLLKKHKNKPTQDNYNIVLLELLDGKSTLKVPLDKTKTYPNRTFTNEENISLLNDSQVLNINSQIFQSAFTDSKSLLEWSGEKTKLTSVKAQDLLTYFKNKELDGIIINSGLPTEFVIQIDDKDTTTPIESLPVKQSSKTDHLTEFKEKMKVIRSDELGYDPILEKINELAEKLILGEKEQVDNEAKKIGSKLTIEEIKRAVDIYLHNAVDMYPEPINYKIMGVIIRYCVAYGEGICEYIDEVAFGEYDWTQYEAIDLLCRMALIQDIRKEKTLELLDENIDNFRYTSLMNSLQSMKNFKNEPIVQKIYERQIKRVTENNDYQEVVNILEMYFYSNHHRFEQYLPLLKKIVTKSNKSDYSTLSMSHIMKGNENGEMIAYNEDGTILNEDESVEAIKLNAAVIYYLTDKNDDEINNYLNYIKLYSKFENHKSYINNSIEI